MSHIAHKSVLLTGALLLASVVTASAQVTYSGRAIAARLSAPAMTTQTAGDTGELPPGGGFLTADQFNVSLVLNDETLLAASVTDTTSGVSDESHSVSHLNQVKFTLNQPPEGITIQEVSDGRDGVAIVFRAEPGKAKPGLKGNLIVDACYVLLDPRIRYR